MLLTASALWSPSATATDDEPVGPHIAALLRGGAEANRAIERLRFLGPRRAGPPLRALLENGDDKTRIAVSSALILLRDPDSASALLKRLTEDSDWEVRSNAAQALGELKHKPATKELARKLETDPHRRVRRSCARALGTLAQRPDALAKAAAKDVDLEVRLAALHSVRDMSRRVTTPLRKLLADDSAMVRFAAARALAWNDDTAARHFLEQRLTKDEEEQRRSVMVLVDLPPREWTTDLLVRALDCSDADAQLEAALTLAKRKRPEAHLVLAHAAVGAHGGRSVKALVALEELGVTPNEIFDAAQQTESGSATP